MAPIEKKKAFMRKRQIIKLNCSKRTKRIGMCVTTAMLTLGISGSVFAGNIQDTGYSYNSTKNGFATATRPKEDATSAYINHAGNVAVNVQVRSSGTNYSANGKSYYIRVGTKAPLPNYVYENGKRNCYLYITPATGAASYLHGVWSPDSVGY